MTYERRSDTFMPFDLQGRSFASDILLSSAAEPTANSVLIVGDGTLKGFIPEDSPAAKMLSRSMRSPVKSHDISTEKLSKTGWRTKLSEFFSHDNVSTFFLFLSGHMATDGVFNGLELSCLVEVWNS
jgi:hypothetical protein